MYVYRMVAGVTAGTYFTMMAESNVLLSPASEVNVCSSIRIGVKFVINVSATSNIELETD